MATAPASRPTLSAESVKAAAEGNWLSIYQSLGGLPAEILDGRHHPCPKCGGVDRFRAIDLDIGGIYCNQCFKGDCIDALCWLRGWTFREALEKLADHLGLGRKSRSGRNGAAAGTKARGKRGGAKTTGPDWQQVDFRPPAILSLFAASYAAAKPPITSSAIGQAAGRPGVWPAKASAENRLDIIAFPVRHPSKMDKPCGALMVRRDGGAFPEIPGQGKGGGLPERKVHLLRGTQCGVVLGCSPDQFAAAETLVKVEGITDLLAAIPLLPTGVAAFSASNGAEAFPPDLAAVTAGKHLIIIHDADTPGQEGAATTAARCLDAAASVRIAHLPYPITDNHGRDLRDWLLDAPADQPRTYDDLLSLAGEPETYESLGADPPGDPPPEIEEAPDDPHRLARICAAKWDRVAFYMDQWYIGDVAAGWQLIDQESEMRSYITAIIKEEFDTLNRTERAEALAAGKPLPKCRKVNSSLVHNTLNALRSISIIPGSHSFNFYLPEKSDD